MLRIAAQVLIGILVLTGGVAHAIPVLQLYIEGSEYDSATESWVFTPTDPAQTSFRLWAIGNVKGPGSMGPIANVRLSVVYDLAYENLWGPLAFSLTATRAGGTGTYGDFVDPSVAGNNDPEVAGGPIYLGRTVVDQDDPDTLPTLSDGSTLPSHGEYRDGKVWREFFLGDFTRKDSQIANFIDDFPTGGDLIARKAQINVYDVVVETANPDAPPIELHFDLYDSVQSGNYAKFAPFSHDAGGDVGTTLVPEPASLALTLIGAVGCGAFAARRKRRRDSSESGTQA